MKMMLTNREIIDFFDAMKQISETEKNHKFFTYAITLNEEKLRPYVVAVLQCGKPDDSYKQYETQREQLIHMYAEKDEFGNIVYDDIYKLIKIKSEYIHEAKAKFDKLDEDNKDILHKRKLELEDYYNILNKVISIDIEQVSLNYFPESMNKIMMKALKPLVLN